MNYFLFLISQNGSESERQIVAIIIIIIIINEIKANATTVWTKMLLDLRVKYFLILPDLKETRKFLNKVTKKNKNLTLIISVQ